MSDIAATLRRLADASEACTLLAGDFNVSAMECFLGERQLLADALPGIGWDGATKELRAMADEVDRLRAEVDRLTAMTERVGPSDLDELCDGDACPSCGYGPVTYHDGAALLSCRDCDWMEGSDV